MWYSDRQRKIKVANELLRVGRTDGRIFTNLSYAIWIAALIVFALTLSLFVLAPSTRETKLMLLFLFLGGFLCFIGVVVYFGMDNRPIIFYDAGFSFRQLIRIGTLWEDVEEYAWIPLTGPYLKVRIFPSNTMPAGMQLLLVNNMIGPIHSDYRKSIDDLFKQRGIGIQSWE